MTEPVTDRSRVAAWLGRDVSTWPDSAPLRTTYERPPAGAPEHADRVSDLVLWALGLDYGQAYVVWTPGRAWQVMFFVRTKRAALALDCMQLAGGVEYFAPVWTCIASGPRLLAVIKEARAALRGEY